MKQYIIRYSRTDLINDENNGEVYRDTLIDTIFIDAKSPRQAKMIGESLIDSIVEFNHCLSFDERCDCEPLDIIDVEAIELNKYLEELVKKHVFYQIEQNTINMEKE